MCDKFDVFCFALNKNKKCHTQEKFKEILYNLGPKVDPKDIAQARRCFSKILTNKTAFSWSPEVM